jgi:hypothetical protein
MQLPKTYKTMCQQCGDIMQHWLDSDEAKRCGNGHFVAPDDCPRRDIKPPAQPGPGHNVTAPGMRPLTGRETQAHNYRLRARMKKKPSAAQIIFEHR